MRAPTATVAVCLGALLLTVLFVQRSRSTSARNDASAAVAAVRPANEGFAMPQRERGAVDEEPPAAATKTRATEIQIVTVDDRPIPGAWLARKEDAATLGKSLTGEPITLELVRLGASRTLFACARGYATKEFRLEDTAAERVRLRTGWTLDGIVLQPGQTPVGEGMLVLAVEPGRHLGVENVRATLRGVPAIQSAMTAESGVFSIEGLDPNLCYVPLVAGKGIYAFDPFSAPLCSDHGTFTQVQAHAVYGVQVLFRTPEGAPLMLGDALNGRWHANAKALVHDARAAHVAGDMLGLLGIEESARLTPYDRTFFFLSDSGNAAIPLAVTARFPGHEPVDFQVEALPLRDSLPQRIVHVHPTADFGSIAVLASPAHLVEIVLGRSAPSAGFRLELTPQEGTALIEARIDAFQGGLASIEGVPHGTYSAVFRAPHQLMRYPRLNDVPIILAVSHDAAEFRLPLADFGCIEIEVLDRSGLQYSGPLRVTQTRLLGRESDELHFWNAPFSIPLLPPGDYNLRINGLDILGDPEIRVSVVAGHTESVRLRLEAE